VGRCLGQEGHFLHLRGSKGYLGTSWKFLGDMNTRPLKSLMHVPDTWWLAGNQRLESAVCHWHAYSFLLPLVDGRGFQAQYA
jgi:hypothetical protein